MDDLSHTFRPFPGETAIYLQQIDRAAADAAAPGGLLAIPADGANAMVGVLGGPLLATMTLPSAILAAATVLIAIFCAIILTMIFLGRIDMRLLLSEADGKASLSRTQAFVFTVVLAASVLSIVASTGNFPAEVPWWILAIMAGSLGTYLASKGIQRSGVQSGEAMTGTAEAARPAASGGSLVRAGRGAASENGPLRMRADGGTYEG